MNQLIGDDLNNTDTKKKRKNKLKKKLIMNTA